jgi:hypothetical protein
MEGNVKCTATKDDGSETDLITLKAGKCMHDYSKK